MEGVTKWDTSCSRIHNEVHCIYSHMKLLQDKVGDWTAISAMQAELMQARLRIQKLEAACESSNKQVEKLLRKLGQERTAWKIREHQKIHTVVNDLKNELFRERKKYKRMQILNSKLVIETVNIKSSAKKLRVDYEEEKKARVLMEGVCDKLANKIAEDKAEVEALKMKTIKIQEELEKERRMLQMAEVWREERVQMKLIDAKMALEDKYCQMNNLLKELENFLRSRGATTLDAVELRKAKLIQQAAQSINVKVIKEFCYVPPKSNDIHSIVEEVRKIEGCEDKTEDRPRLVA